MIRINNERQMAVSIQRAATGQGGQVVQGPNCESPTGLSFGAANTRFFLPSLSDRDDATRCLQHQLPGLSSAAAHSNTPLCLAEDLSLSSTVGSEGTLPNLLTICPSVVDVRNNIGHCHLHSNAAVSNQQQLANLTSFAERGNSAHWAPGQLHGITSPAAHAELVPHHHIPRHADLIHPPPAHLQGLSSPAARAGPVPRPRSLACRLPCHAESMPSHHTPTSFVSSVRTCNSSATPHSWPRPFRMTTHSPANRLVLEKSN